MGIPEELTADLEAFAARWEEPTLCAWLKILPAQLAQSMSEKRYGDLKRWRESMHALPELTASAINLDGAYVGATGEVTDTTRADLEQALRGLHPWRKGPFSLFGVDIETEWRSDFKWERLADAISPLQGRRVLRVHLRSSVSTQHPFSSCSSKRSKNTSVTLQSTFCHSRWSSYRQSYRSLIPYFRWGCSTIVDPP
jgi:hypothetical protein